ncbi:MAG: hypothetical protein ABI629_18685 [bacterium]
MIGHRTDQRFGHLVVNQRHLDPARPLEARRKEVQALDTLIEVLHLDLPEVVLQEFAGQSLEAHLHRFRRRAQRGDQFIERRLAAPVAGEPRPAQDLHREQCGRALQELLDQSPMGLDEAWTTHQAADLCEHRGRRHHRFLAGNATHRSFADAGKLGHLRLRVTDRQQQLDLVAFERVEHSHHRWRGCSAARSARRPLLSIPVTGAVLIPGLLAKTGQDFRNSYGQNFRNRQRAMGFPCSATARYARACASKSSVSIATRV